jgi:hypothetical protein
MGWNSSVILVEGSRRDAVKRALPDVFDVTQQTIDWGEASSSSLFPNAALGEIPGWTVIWTPNDRLALFPEFLEPLSQTGRAMSFVLSSVSTIYGFALAEGGKLRRMLFRENFKEVSSEGEPILEEAGLDWEDDEDTIFELARRLTGLEVNDWRVWVSVRFNLIRLG